MDRRDTVAFTGHGSQQILSAFEPRRGEGGLTKGIDRTPTDAGGGVYAEGANTAP